MLDLSYNLIENFETIAQLSVNNKLEILHLG